MSIKATELFMKDNNDKIRVWAISADDNVIVIRHGQVGGSMQFQTEVVSKGKATRSLEEQIMSRMASRISSQRDKGYRLSYDEAAKGRPTNIIGLPKPMLAKKYADVKNIDFEGAIVQPKFDGNRCLIYCENGVNKAYTRNGKPIDSITHILEDIDLTEGEIVDGELYCHEVPLQTIVSWVKRKQENTLKLKYHLYDVVSELPYTSRAEILKGIPRGPSIIPAPSFLCGNKGTLADYFRKFRAEGYEGAILRWGNIGYEDGKRSKSLVKVKAWNDAEFLVVDIFESRDGWAILKCVTQSGDEFRVSSPGNIPFKTDVLRNKEDYIGRMVTVEYANLTMDGIPFHPIATGFRDAIQ